MVDPFLLNVLLVVVVIILILASPAILKKLLQWIFKQTIDRNSVNEELDMRRKDKEIIRHHVSMETKRYGGG